MIFYFDECKNLDDKAINLKRLIASSEAMAKQKASRIRSFMFVIRLFNEDKKPIAYKHGSAWFSVTKK